MATQNDVSTSNPAPCVDDIDTGVTAPNTKDPPRSVKPKVVIHNGGGPLYDQKRPAEWDSRRWK
ncbi:hypothetical protein Egran_07100 [Elaphomyces granulatus]|uniref:Uncharacterized protein n=1 Tax=Elaphomyces granulatus TaxID=519963 RepID=A0A232LLV6_9EURO|nr:hypothetical protein Egran_07100 [Elaphomyces granulatus]